MRKVILFAVLVSCAAPAPSHPAFAGHETDAWFAFDVELPKSRDPRDLVQSFEASARSFGCTTERLTASRRMAGRSELGGWYGTTASCKDDTIALVALDEERVSVGCARPTTRERCEDLLRRISEGR